MYLEREKKDILALGGESAGNFSFYQSGKIFHSPDFGDLLIDVNFKRFNKDLNGEIRKAGLKPKVIISDLHPDFLTTKLAERLAKKYKARHIPVQHHIAHIFSAIGDRLIQDTKYKIPDIIYGVACDGTGLGTDGKIWGGEIFKISKSKLQISNKFQNPKSKVKIERIGHLENQILIGGDLAIREPARILISILDKFLPKEEIYGHVRKYYTKNEFELLYSQLKQNFNCLETSSAGRVLDAVSILLGFCGNERKYKHEPIDKLEKNSTVPYADLKPKIVRSKDNEYILDTTYLFNYVINYLHKDKKRLAATAQLYIAEGLCEIFKNIQNSKFKIQNSFLSGGMANNKIISSYLESKGAYVSKKILRGDAGLSFGQIIYCLLADPRD